MPKGDVDVVGDIHSHTVGRGFADQENFSKSTFAQDGDQKLNDKLAGLDHYLLTPKGKLKVLRDDGEYKEIAYYDKDIDDFSVTNWFVGPKGRDKYGNILPLDDEEYDLAPSNDRDPIKPGKAKYPWDWLKLDPMFKNRIPPPQIDPPSNGSVKKTKA